jgi:hypothetical protein
MKRSLRATALSKPEPAPPATGTTFAHAYDVMRHLGKPLPSGSTGSEEPQTKTSDGAAHATAPAQPSEGKPPVRKHFTLRDGNVIARSLKRLPEWQSPDAAAAQAPSEGQAPDASQGGNEMTEVMLKARFRRIHHKIPKELHLPEPKVEPPGSQVK